MVSTSTLEVGAVSAWASAARTTRPGRAIPAITRPASATPATTTLCLVIGKKTRFTYKIQLKPSVAEIFCLRVRQLRATSTLAGLARRLFFIQRLSGEVEEREGQQREHDDADPVVVEGVVVAEAREHLVGGGFV